MIYLDIETKGNTLMFDKLPAIRPPSNYRDPAKIEAYLAEKRIALMEEIALDIDLCRIVAVSYARDGSDITTVLCEAQSEEKQALDAVWGLLAEFPNDPVCGYNVLGFDLPVILRRSMAHRIHPTRWISLAKFNNHDVLDLMLLLYNFGSFKFRGLKDVCNFLGIANPLPGKDGSMVNSMTPDELRAYSANDVHLTRELARRTQSWYW